MKSKRVFYRTTFKVTVLAEEPTTDLTVADMIAGCDRGPMVGDTDEFKMESVTGKEMADALIELRSTPEFFCLDDEGNDLFDESPRAQVDQELHRAGVIEDPDMDGGLLG